jgi:hypothetical protein
MCHFGMNSKKINPKKKKHKIKKIYLHDYSLIHTVLYFFTYLFTYIDKKVLFSNYLCR